jgi:hypothetical protein
MLILNISRDLKRKYKNHQQNITCHVYFMLRYFQPQHKSTMDNFISWWANTKTTSALELWKLKYELGKQRYGIAEK